MLNLDSCLQKSPFGQRSHTEVQLGQILLIWLGLSIREFWGLVLWVAFIIQHIIHVDRVNYITVINIMHFLVVQGLLVIITVWNEIKVNSAFYIKYI